jgi:hypothetical protein
MWHTSEVKGSAWTVADSNEYLSFRTCPKVNHSFDSAKVRFGKVVNGGNTFPYIGFLLYICLSGMGLSIHETLGGPSVN